jgi:hypothetical protein
MWGWGGVNTNFIVVKLLGSGYLHPTFGCAGGQSDMHHWKLS